jgi:peptidoglycan/LPS O-acetylase OafA/YrhL
MAAMQFHIGFQKVNVIAATLTFYLVVTALLTVRRRDPNARWIDAITMIVAMAAGLFAIFIGIDAMGRSKSWWFPAVPVFVFGTIALLAAFGDMRLAMGRVLDPPHRIARHLWRMCFAMFIATGSFFLGQAKVFPEELRVLPLLAAPVVIVLVTMFFWWIRVLVTKRVPGLTSRRRPPAGSAPARGLVAE